MGIEYMIYDYGDLKNNYMYSDRTDFAEYIIKYFTEKKQIQNVYDTTHWQWDKAVNNS